MAIEFETKPDVTPPGVQKALDTARHEIADVLNGKRPSVSEATRRNLRDRAADPAVRPYADALAAWEEAQQKTGTSAQPIIALTSGSQPDITPAAESPTDGNVTIQVLDTYVRRTTSPYDIPRTIKRHKVAVGDKVIDLSHAQTEMLAALTQLPPGTHIEEPQLDKQVFAGQTLTTQRMHAVRTNMIQKVNAAAGPLIDFLPASGGSHARIGITPGREVSFGMPKPAQTPWTEPRESVTRPRGGLLGRRQPQPARG